jgi:hypothetical protein
MTGFHFLGKLNEHLVDRSCPGTTVSSSEMSSVPVRCRRVMTSRPRLPAGHAELVLRIGQQLQFGDHEVGMTTGYWMMPVWQRSAKPRHR